jgi:hypothetical protein
LGYCRSRKIQVINILVRSLSKVYYKGAAGIIIVYDITEPQTYLDV